MFGWIVVSIVWFLGSIAFLLRAAQNTTTAVSFPITTADYSEYSKLFDTSYADTYLPSDRDAPLGICFGGGGHKAMSKKTSNAAAMP